MHLERCTCSHVNKLHCRSKNYLSVTMHSLDLLNLDPILSNIYVLIIKVRSIQTIDAMPYIEVF